MDAIARAVGIPTEQRWKLLLNQHFYSFHSEKRQMICLDGPLLSSSLQKHLLLLRLRKVAFLRGLICVEEGIKMRQSNKFGFILIAEYLG